MLNYYPLLCGCTPPHLSSVICPDVVGRGRSSRLANAALYGYAQYVADAVHLVGTVLALKAIIAYDVKSSRPKAAGSLVLELDGEEVDRVAFTEHSEGALAFSASKVQCTAVQQTCRSCHTGETVSVVAFIAMYCRWSWRSSPRQRTVSTSEWSRLL